jgi:hypothetical protein
MEPGNSLSILIWGRGRPASTSSHYVLKVCSVITVSPVLRFLTRCLVIRVYKLSHTCYASKYTQCSKWASIYRYNTQELFCSWISYGHLSTYTTSLYLFSFVWRYILLSLVRIISALINFHFEHCMYYHLVFLGLTAVRWKQTRSSPCKFLHPPATSTSSLPKSKIQLFSSATCPHQP